MKENSIKLFYRDAMSIRYNYKTNTIVPCTSPSINNNFIKKGI